LRVAARHQDLGAGIFALDAANGGAGILIGGSGNGAGVQDDDFGLVRSARALEAAIEQLTLNGRAVGLGRAAPEVLHMIRRHRLIILGTDICPLRPPGFKKKVYDLGQRV